MPGSRIDVVKKMDEGDSRDFSTFPPAVSPVWLRRGDGVHVYVYHEILSVMMLVGVGFILHMSRCSRRFNEHSSLHQSWGENKWSQFIMRLAS